MNWIPWLALPFIIIAICSLIYKAVLDRRIEHPEIETTIWDVIAFRRYYFWTLFPVSTKADDPAEKKLRQKANKTLAVFYACMAITFLLSYFAPKVS